MEEGLPTFVIVGAMKCGTSSMAKWLSDHPDVYLPVRGGARVARDR